MPPAVATATGVAPFAPTNTQFVPVWQLIAFTAVNDDAAAEFGDHCWPPLLVVKSGAGAPLKAEPAAWQAVLEHDT